MSATVPATKLSGATLRPTPAPAATALRLDIEVVMLLLSAAVGIVILASLAAAWGRLDLGIAREDVSQALDQLSKVTKFLIKFDMGSEQTVAAWLSSVLMLLCGLLLLYIGGDKRLRGGAYTFHWLLLGVIFVGLSADESVAMHELVNKMARSYFDAGGIFFYAWIIPGMAFVGLVGITYLGFLSHLENVDRVRFILAGGVFVGGAVGLEMVEGVLADWYAEAGWPMEIAVHIEETMEFAGLLLFLYALLDHARRHCRTLTLALN